MTGERGSQRGHGGATIRHVQPRGRSGVVGRLGGLGENRGGTGRKRVIDEAMPVESGAADGGENRPRGHLA